MAKKTETTVTLVDDLDGSKADRTVAFTVEGKSYEIELSKKNATAFDKALAPYIAAARRVTNTTRSARSRTARPTTSRSDLAAVREWATTQGITVSERGRVAGDVLEAYDAAH